MQAAWWDDTPGVGETYSYPNRPAFRGAPKIHDIIGGTGSAFWNWGTTSPEPTVLPNDNFSGELTGLIYLSTAGNWTFSGQADDGMVMTIDDQLVVNTWATPLAKVVSPAFSLTAGWHQISVAFREDTGGASLELWYTPPGGSETVIPNTSLKPDLGLVTTLVDPNNISTTTGYQHAIDGLASISTQDPGGLALTQTRTYESPGTGWLRQTNRALPADASQSRNTSTYTPYGATETNPAVTCAGTIPAVGTFSQRGLPHLTRDADPTAAGGNGGITREQVQDDAGRVVANRVSTDPKWSCVAFDSRGRPTTKTYPSGGGQPERTVTFGYSVGGDPMLSSVTDSAGTITTRVDLLGRTTDTQDVWGTITHTDYDAAGRPTQSTVFNTTGAVIERTMSDYATTGSGVDQQSATRWSNAAATVSAYTYASLWATAAMPTITGTTLASMSFDTVGRPTTTTYGSGVQSVAGFDTYQRPNSITDTKAATSITSDAVTRDLTGRVTDETVDGTDANPSGANYTYDNAGRLTDWYMRDPSSGNVTHGNYNFTYTQGAPANCSSNGWYEPQAGRNSNRLEARTQLNGGAWSTTSYCYDHADRLRLVNPPSGSPNPYSNITYDAHGNTTQLGGEALVYDGADRHIGTTNAVAPNALLVVGVPTALTNRDAWMKQRLIDDGWSVTVADDDGFTAAAATGKQLVVITDSVAGTAATAVGATLKTVAVPVLDSESFIYDDLGMTGLANGTDFGSTAADQTQLTVTAAGAGSPLGAGLKPGATTMSSTSVTTGWGKPSANAVSRGHSSV